jgi:hypothetical protein
MICPNKDCRRNVSPFDATCPNCGTALKSNPVSDYEKKANGIVNRVAGRTEALREEIRSGFKMPQNSFRSGGLVHTVTDNLKVGIQGGIFMSSAQTASSGSVKANVNVDHIKRINWSLINLGVPVVFKIDVENQTDIPIESVIIRIKLTQNYSDSWTTTIDKIAPAERKRIKDIKLPIFKERFRTVKESEQSFISVEMETAGNIFFSSTFEVQIDPYNQWFVFPSLEASLAGFIIPNSSSVGEVILNTGEHLKRLCDQSSLHGYQMQSKYTEPMVHAIYLAFQKSLKIDYINPPSSFDPPGQKVLVANDILKLKRGTCLDLALFYAACIERIGLYPLVFLIPGHAYTGVWKKEEYFMEFSDWQEENTDDIELYKKAIEKEYILPLDSVTFTFPKKDFQCCKQDGLKHCKELNGVVDVVRVRDRVKPMALEGE